MHQVNIHKGYRNAAPELCVSSRLRVSPARLELVLMLLTLSNLKLRYDMFNMLPSCHAVVLILK